MAVIVGTLLMPRLGGAHTLGLSAASFEVGPDGRVEARLTFAAADAPRKDLERFVLDGVGIDADGAPCSATFDGAETDAVDGLVLHATYRCPGDAETIGATLYYLSALPAGHRGVAGIRAGPLTSEAVLSGDARYVELKLPPRPRRKASALVVAASGALAAAAIGVFLVRRRKLIS